MYQQSLNYSTPSLQHSLLNILSPLLRPTAHTHTKKISFQILLFIDNAPGHPRALMEMYNEMNVFHVYIHSVAHGSRSHFNY